MEYQPFLKALIEFHLPELLIQATGSTFPNVSYPQLANLQCDLPPLNEQRAIAHILGTMDDKIELNRRMNETLEAMARAIFKSWFVDFDPVRAKAAGRDPGLPKHIADLFPDSFEDSELGEIPKGWEVLEWGNIATLEYGKRLSNYDKAVAPYPVYVTNGLIGWHNTPLCPQPGIIIGRKGAYRGIHFSDYPFFVIDTAFYLKEKVDFDMRWVYYTLLNIDISNMDSGSAIPSTSREVIKNQKVIFPNLNIQKFYRNILDPFWKKQSSNNNEIYILKDIRDALLPKLISGEIRVKDAEKFVSRMV